MLGGIWQYGQMPRSLDGHGDSPLVSGAQTALTTRIDRAAIANKATQVFNSLPIYNQCFVRAKRTNFAPMVT
jgi:hypothetical protein